MDANTLIPDAINKESDQPKSWRDVMPVHPAADLFPPMNDAELRELAADIKKNGQTEKVAFYDDPELGLCVLDGRNRLEALELLEREDGFESELAKELTDRFGWVTYGRKVPEIASEKFDPYAYVISKNIHRRHLSPEERNDLIAKVLKARPEASNRRIAAELKVDHKKVSAVRRVGEATGEISPVERTTGKDGKARRVRRAATGSKQQDDSKPSALSSKPQTDLVTYDFANLENAMAEAKARAIAGNTTGAKEALKALRTEIDRALAAGALIVAPTVLQ